MVKPISTPSNSNLHTIGEQSRLISALTCQNIMVSTTEDQEHVSLCHGSIMSNSLLVQVLCCYHCDLQLPHHGNCH